LRAGWYGSRLRRRSGVPAFSVGGSFMGCTGRASA
jgi:hypothetical protein